ncbi:MAG: MBL fold metallo-hydrolase [Clostridia bacterium]|nr:MBL fold metallo-hydrolase [Clostridia bacterium]
MKNTLYMLASEEFPQMNSFIITTADGKVIVIDGGWRADAAKLLSRLRGITGEEVPHVDAWFHSHAHADHTEAFMEIMENHGESVTVGAVYFHFPSVQYFEKYEAGSAYTVREFYELLPRFADKACIVSEGDRYEVGEAVFDILYTADPAFRMNAVNNSSTVFRMTLGGKRVLFLGDLGIEAGQKLLSQYGDALKSDWCQMAHHGQSGVERDVYEAIAPEGCLWSTPKWLWDNDAGKGFNTHIWQTVTVRGWMDEIGAKRHLVTKDGDQVLEF